MDKYGTLKFRYFLKGDHVLTGHGVGIVAEDEEEIKSEEHFHFSEIKIQHKVGYSENPENSIESIEREILSLVSKHYYERVKL